jgi:hypothetical protein
MSDQGHSTFQADEDTRRGINYITSSKFSSIPPCWKSLWENNKTNHTTRFSFESDHSHDAERDFQNHQ